MDFVKPFEDVSVELNNHILRITFDSADHQNKINGALVSFLLEVLEKNKNEANIVLLEGNDEYFCTGADFNDNSGKYHPEDLYDLWYKLATGPYVTVSYVKGKVIAGGMGFVSASDIVIAGLEATFCLSELLFGLYPAMVMPFLTRKAGFSVANYMTLSARTLNVNAAYEKGIVDYYGEKCNSLLAQHLTRISKFPKSGIISFKEYMRKINPIIERCHDLAVESNKKMFQLSENQERINDFISSGKYSWMK